MPSSQTGSASNSPTSPAATQRPSADAIVEKNPSDPVRFNDQSMPFGDVSASPKPPTATNSLPVHVTALSAVAFSASGSVAISQVTPSGELAIERGSPVIAAMSPTATQRRPL